MDESWRVTIGSIDPRRRSTEEGRRRRGGQLAEANPAAALDPDDFRDVFGGPPRSVLLRRFSADLFSSATAAAHADHRPLFSYEEASRPRGFPVAGGGGGGVECAGRNLSWLRIPSKGAASRAGLVRTEVGFYDDIFGSNGGRGGGDRRSRSRSKSKSKLKSKSSSSILTSEDVSPPVGASSLAAEDAVLSSFTSKLRAITIPSKHQISSPPSTISGERHNTWQASSMNSFASGSYLQDSKDFKSNCQSSSDIFRQKSHIGFSCCFSPPETVSLEASFRRSSKEPPPISYNSDLDSPSSAISSSFRDPLPFQAERQTKMVTMEIEEGIQVSETSFTIEMGRPRLDEREDAAAIDEAIAWAKQKFRNHQAPEVEEIGGEGIHFDSMRDGTSIEEQPLQLTKKRESDYR